MDHILQEIAHCMHVHLLISLLGNNGSPMGSILTTLENQGDGLPVTLSQPLVHPSHKRKPRVSQTLQDQLHS